LINEQFFNFQRIANDIGANQWVVSYAYN
jgi:hypothetical protein